jgi:hypothetical protein
MLGIAASLPRSREPPPALTRRAADGKAQHFHIGLDAHDKRLYGVRRHELETCNGMLTSCRALLLRWLRPGQARTRTSSEVL